MNKEQIEGLKAVSEAAHSAYNAEKDRLTAAGFKSAERYALLKPLKAVADAAHASYSKAAVARIKRELDKIIAQDRPNQEAEARARSAWKQAKYDASK